MDVDDALLEARILDAAGLCERRRQPQFLGFLDERQKMLAERCSKGLGEVCFWGGYESAQRTFLGIFPGAECAQALFPLAGLEITFRSADALSHRDVLGALMALGIKRETIGDILLEPGRAVLFVQKATAPYLLEQLSKIGRVGVRCARSENPLLPPPGEMETVACTVSSLRVDSVLSAVLPLSRAKCTDLIRSGAVTLRFEECKKPDAAVAAGDVFSVRGHGKFRLDACGGQSKKGRLHITIKRYL